MIYSDIWDLSIDLNNNNRYQIFESYGKKGRMPISSSFAEFLDRFLNTGLWSLYCWLGDSEVNRLKSDPDARVAQFKVSRVTRITNRGITLIGKIISGKINTDNTVCMKTDAGTMAFKIKSVKGVRITYNPFQVGLSLDYLKTNRDDDFKNLEGQTIDIFQLIK